MAKLIFGCGYLGKRVANASLAQSETVAAVTRSQTRGAALQAEGIIPIIGDVVKNPDVLAKSLKTVLATESEWTVLFAVGFDRSTGDTITKVYIEGVENALAMLPETNTRFIYISSTGVYSQTDGSWVDETSETAPTREGGKACLRAEQIVGDSRIADRAVILRLAGIYGPGRTPRKADIVAGAPIAAPTDGYLNLIHVDDAVQCVTAAERHASPSRLYGIVDNEPVLRRTYYQYLAELFNAPSPTFVEAPTDNPKAKRAAADKRVSNRRMHEELKPQLLYPTYREGLRASME